jgi:UvrB/uvrC motif
MFIVSESACFICYNARLEGEGIREAGLRVKEKTMRRDIDDALHDWPYKPEPGEVIAREVRAREGRMVLQIRVELGILQLEVEGRPDGSRPHQFNTYLDYLRYRAASRGLAPEGKSPPWKMSSEQCEEADREFVQFYHRRVAWLALQRYEKAVLDADHTLALMDFVCRHGITPEYTASHEKYRGLVLFHRTQAAAALELERRRAEDAIDVVRDGIEKLQAHQQAWDAEHDQEESPNASLIEQLRLLEGEIRKNFAVEKTLREQFDEAVATEDYELAARLRDEIRARGQK